MIDLGGVAVIKSGDIESAIREAGIPRQRGSNFTNADDTDAPLLSKSQNLSKGGRKLGNRVAESALTE